MGNIRKFIFNGVLVFVSVAVTLFFLEAFLRATKYKQLLSVSSSNGERERFFVSAVPYYFQNDPAAGYDIVENSSPSYHSIYATESRVFRYKIWANELGCFDNPYLGEKNYILLAGDSFCWGFSPFEDKWGSVIERESGRRVLKCGVAGYGTKQELLKIDKVVSRVKNKPAVIILGYFYDLHDDYIFPRYAVTNGYLVPKVILKDANTGEKVVRSEQQLREYADKAIKDYYGRASHSGGIFARLNDGIAENSIIYNLGARAVKKIGRKTGIIPTSSIAPAPGRESGWLAAAWGEHLDNIKKIKALSKRYNCRLLVVLIPPREQVYGFQTPRRNDEWEYSDKKLKSFLKKENIEYYDLAPEFRKYANQNARQALDPDKDLYWAYDGHWNINGNRLAGLLVSNYLLEKNIISAQGAVAQRQNLLRKKLQEFHAD